MMCPYFHSRTFTTTSPSICFQGPNKGTCYYAIQHCGKHEKNEYPMSMWHSLSILGQAILLREALEIDVLSQVVGEPSKVVFTNQGVDTQDDNQKRSQTECRDVKSPPFYVSLIIRNNLVLLPHFLTSI